MTALPVLTTRQQEVAQLVADGLTTKAIAAQLGITVTTVNLHVGAIADRLGLPGSHATRTLIARWWWAHAA